MVSEWKAWMNPRVIELKWIGKGGRERSQICRKKGRKTKSSLCLSLGLTLLSSSRHVVALDHNECVKIYTESHKTLAPGFEILLNIVTAYVDYDQQKLRVWSDALD